MFEGFVVLVLHLGVQRLVHTFLTLTLLLLFDSSILRNHGCPVYTSLRLAFRAHALQRSACFMLFLQGLLHCPTLVLSFCSSASST